MLKSHKVIVLAREIINRDMQGILVYTGQRLTHRHWLMIQGSLRICRPTHLPTIAEGAWRHPCDAANLDGQMSASTSGDGQ